MRLIGRSFRPICAFMLGAASVLGTNFGEAAELIVADQANGRVVAFDADTGAFTRTLTTGLLQPSAISHGPGGAIYVTDLIAGNVLKINPSTGASSVFVSGLEQPGSLHYDEWNDTLYVGEFGDFTTFNFGDEVFNYNAAGELIATINAGPFGHSGLTTDEEGNLYVSNFATDQLTVPDAN